MKTVMSLRAKVILSSALVLFGATVAKGAEPPSSQKLTPLRVSVIGVPGATYWDLYGAQSLDYFTNAGVQASITSIDTPSQAAQALVSGAVDIASLPAEVAISAIEKGADLKIIGAQNAKPHFSFMASSAIKDYADLKGKTIAVSQMNEAGVTMLRKLLAQNGLERDDYTLLQLGTNANRMAALAKGVVDATFLSPPLDFRVQAEAGAHRLGYIYEAFDGPYMVYTVQDKWAQDNAQAVTGFLTAVVQSARWLHTPANQDQAIEIFQEHARARPQDSVPSYDAFYGKHQIMARDVAIDTGSVQAYIDLRGGGPRSAASFLDLSYRDRALEGLK